MGRGDTGSTVPLPVLREMCQHTKYSKGKKTQKEMKSVKASVIVNILTNYMLFLFSDTHKSCVGDMSMCRMTSFR